MVTIRVKFRPSRKGGSVEGTIIYEVRLGGNIRRVDSGYKIPVSLWDEIRSTLAVLTVCVKVGDSSDLRERIVCDVRRIVRIDNSLRELGLQYDVSDVVEGFKRYKREFSLFVFMKRCIDNLRVDGKIRTAETYQSTLNSFKRFRSNNDVMLDSIRSDTMMLYEAWLADCGVVPNTSSFYMRILRAVYNRAVRMGAIVDNKPFKAVYTGVAKTVKRALPLAVIRELKKMDLSQYPSLNFARDMFMLSFYMRGISFVDMAFLKKTDLCDGYVNYRRRKTGQHIVIEWTSEMQATIDRYPTDDTEYLLPILSMNSLNPRRDYSNMSYKINYSLKQIAGMIGIVTPLTLYVARHCWASVAKRRGIPVSVISEGLGHDRESTTQIYLANLEEDSVDVANRMIIRELE